MDFSESVVVISVVSVKHNTLSELNSNKKPNDTNGTMAMKIDNAVFLRFNGQVIKLVQIEQTEQLTMSSSR